MAQLTKSVSLTLNVPFYDGAVAGVATVPTQGREAYLDALEREVKAAAGDAAGAKVRMVRFVGGTAANMTLARWCRVMDDVRTSFPGSDVALLRFDVTPDLVNQKTAAYAFRYRALFNLVLERLDRKSVDEVRAVRDVLLAEKLDSFGIQVPASALEDASCVAHVLEVRPAYVLAASGPVRPEVAAALKEAGYAQRMDGFYCLHPRACQWFRPDPDEGIFGFGAGSTTKTDEDQFETVADTAMYTELAGLSGQIYR